MNAPAIDYSALIGVLYQKMTQASSYLLGVTVPENNLSLFGSAQPVNPLAQVQMAQVVSAIPREDPARVYFDAIQSNGVDQVVEQSGTGLLVESIPQIWHSLQVISLIISLVLIVLLVYVLIRRAQVAIPEDGEVSEQGMMFFKNVEGFNNQTTGQDIDSVRKRWNAIVGHANSENPNDWRHASIEADIMLDEMLDAQGYKGATMGEKMKQVERSDFNTIDMAWEAHKMRNRIAHEGSNQVLNERLIRQTIAQYQSVFREFELI